jgi:hypothetical protein
VPSACRWAQGAEIRSCSSRLLRQETAEQVTSVHPALVSYADNVRIGGWARRLQSDRPIRPMRLPGSMFAALLRVGTSTESAAGP